MGVPLVGFEAWETESCQASQPVWSPQLRFLLRLTPLE